MAGVKYVASLVACTPSLKQAGVAEAPHDGRRALRRQARQLRHLRLTQLARHHRGDYGCAINGFDIEVEPVTADEAGEFRLPRIAAEKTAKPSSLHASRD
jgi:hypothetical protein